MTDLTVILIICLVITELLPFMRYFTKQFKDCDSIILLVYNTIKNLLHWIRNAKTREQQESARIEKIVEKVLHEHAVHHAIEKALPPPVTIVLPSRHGTTENHETLPPIKPLV